MHQTQKSLRLQLIKYYCCFALLWSCHILTNQGVVVAQAKPDPASTGLRISTFDIDVTPPVGSHLAYDPEINKWNLGLRAKGVVLLGSGKPIVMCAIDWILILFWRRSPDLCLIVTKAKLSNGQSQARYL